MPSERGGGRVASEIRARQRGHDDGLGLLGDLVALLPVALRRGRDAGGRARRRPRRASPRPDRGLARLPHRPGRQRPHARPGLRLDVARVRHARLLPCRPPPRRPGRLSTSWSATAGSGASGCAWTACSTTSARTTRSSGVRSRRVRTPRPGRWVTWDNGYTIGFEGNLDLVELNFAHPPVVDYIVDVMCFWLDRGVDGWRLDAAFAPGGAAWRPIIDRVEGGPPGGVDRRRADQRAATRSSWPRAASTR